MKLGIAAQTSCRAVLHLVPLHSKQLAAHECSSGLLSHAWTCAWRAHDPANTARTNYLSRFRGGMNRVYRVHTWNIAHARSAP